MQVIITIGGIVFLLVLLFTPSDVSNVTRDVTRSRELNHASADDIRAAYDPIVHKARLEELVQIPCVVKTPTREEAVENPNGWTISRYVSYYNVVRFLEHYLNDSGKRYKVHDFGVSKYLEPFLNRLDVNRSGYPMVDIHKTPYDDGTYDIVATDQVIEHVLFPHAAVLELKRILKPDGILIITTCAYNPYHGSKAYRDYWRFMPEGLKTFALPFDGGIKICGGWGTKDVIATRAKHGLLTSSEKKEHEQMLPDAVSNNDKNDPFTTWIIMQK